MTTVVCGRAIRPHWKPDGDNGATCDPDNRLSSFLSSRWQVSNLTNGFRARNRQNRRSLPRQRTRRSRGRSAEQTISRPSTIFLFRLNIYRFVVDCCWLLRVRRSTRLTFKVNMSKKAKTTPKEELPRDFSLKDTKGVSWTVKNIIGCGGFGYVYCGIKTGDRTNKEYAIKTENMESGPLFVERMFYLKHMKKEDVENWITKKKLKELPIPNFYGFGSTVYNSNKYRFIVIEKFDKDLETFLKTVPDKLLLGGVINVVRQIIDALEFIHTCGYVHWDIKSQNIFIGKKPKENHVYLGDFGMVTKYKTEDVVPNKKFANNGTQNYIALDGHAGMHTRRADLESLMYNGLEWLKLDLPWKDKTLKKTIECKNKMKDAILAAGPKEKIFDFNQVPLSYFKTMKIIYNMEPAEKPDYVLLKKLLKQYKTEIVSSSLKIAPKTRNKQGNL